jgi:hypothetical protein
VTTEPGTVLVLFDDQSSMKIKTAGAAAVSPGSKVKSVHETKPDFRIEFEDGSSATLCWPIRARPLPSEIKTMRWNTSDKSDDYLFV